MWFAIVAKPEVKFPADHPFQDVVDHLTWKVAEVDFIRFDLHLEIRKIVAVFGLKVGFT